MGRTFLGLMAIVGVGLFASVANAAVFGWDFDQVPNYYNPELGYNNPMTRVGEGFASLAAGDYGPPHWAGLQDGTNGPAGTGRFVDSGSWGDHGYYYSGFTGAFTVDMLVGPEAEPQGTLARAMSLREAGGNGRGVRIKPGHQGGNHIQLQFFDGSGGVAATIEIPKTTDDTIMHKIRFSLANDGRVVVYDLERDLDPGPGYNYAYMGECNNLGGSGWFDPETSGGNLSLGSFGGGSTMFMKTLFDWVYVDDAVARDATVEAMPEPATLIMLVLCAAPLLRRKQ